MKMSPLHMTLGTSEAPRFRPSIRPLFLVPRRLVGRTPTLPPIPRPRPRLRPMSCIHICICRVRQKSSRRGSVRCSDLQHHSNRVNDILFSTASLRPPFPLSSSSSFARVSPSAQTANSARSADPLRGLRLRLPPFILSLASPVSTPRFRSFDAAALLR